MKKLTMTLVFVLFGCSYNVEMKKTHAVSMQPKLILTTEGAFWGFGTKGRYTISDIYNGKYSRDASNSSWFNTVEMSEGEMIAELYRGNESWTLLCSGESTNFNIGSLSFYNDEPYTCKIKQNDETVGIYEIRIKRETISFSNAEKQVGYIEVNDMKFMVESVHQAKDGSLDVSIPLGYRFLSDDKEIAIAQVNGLIYIQSLPNLTEQQLNVIALGTVASALSWKP